MQSAQANESGDDTTFATVPDFHPDGPRPEEQNPSFSSSVHDHSQSFTAFPEQREEPSTLPKDAVAQSFTQIHHRKPRPDSVLLNLSDEDQEQLNEWLLSYSYTRVLKLLARPRSEGGLGIRTHRASLSRYYNQVMPGFIDERRQRTLTHGKNLSQTAHQLDLPTIEAIKQRTLEATLNPHCDADLLKLLLSTFLKLQQQEIVRDKHDLKLAQAIQHERCQASRLGISLVESIDQVYQERRIERLGIPPSPPIAADSPASLDPLTLERQKDSLNHICPAPNEADHAEQIPSDQTINPSFGPAPGAQPFPSEIQNQIDPAPMDLSSAPASPSENPSALVLLKARERLLSICGPESAFLFEDQDAFAACPRTSEDRTSASHLAAPPQEQTKKSR